MMGYHYGNWGAGEWIAMSALMLLFWGLLIGLAVMALRGFRRGGQTSGGRSGGLAGPGELLAERYARGEIDEEEFLRRRELLHSSADPRP